MVDYCLDLVNCTTAYFNRKRKNLLLHYETSIIDHDEYCLFPAPRYYCEEHWNLNKEDNFPFYETVTTWRKNIRPTRAGKRNPEHLREINKAKAAYTKRYRDGYNYAPEDLL